MPKFIITKLELNGQYDDAGQPVRVREYMIVSRSNTPRWTRDEHDSRIAKFPTRVIAEAVVHYATDLDLTDKSTIREVAE